ncbi:MAG: EamA family transporter [Candidatus Micrarchaeaceae archaeon]
MITKIKLLANTYLVIALLLGAGLPVILTVASSLDIAQFLFYAYLIGAASALALMLATGRRKKLLQHIKNPKSFALIAGIGVLNYALLEFGLAYAEKFISASLATVVYRTYPLLMLMFLPLLLRERVTKYQVAALLLGVFGIYFAFAGGSLGLLDIEHAGAILIVLGVAIASALATVLVKKYSFDIVIGMFIFNMANAAIFGAIVLVSNAPLFSFNFIEVAALLFVGIGYNLITGVLYYSAFRMLKSTFVANIYFLSPFITILYAGFFLGEAILPYYLIIAGLVAAGMIIQKFDPLGGTYLNYKPASTDRILFDVTSAFINTKDSDIYNAISAGGRVLAINAGCIPVSIVEKVISNVKRINVLVYADYHDNVKEDEREFAREIVGAKGEDKVIMCAGSQTISENVLYAIASMLQSTNQI